MPIPTDSFHAEFSNSDASGLSEANSRLTLYAPGSTTALTLNANDHVLITDIDVAIGATSRTVSIYSGADATVDAGELAHKVTPAANTSAHARMSTAHTCIKGTWPKVKTSGAGQVDVVMHGYICRVGV